MNNTGIKNLFIQTIVSADPAVRNRSITEIAQSMGYEELLHSSAELEQFRRSSTNLYERVRACIFLSHIYRFYLMEAPETPRAGYISFSAYEKILDRRYEEALKQLFGCGGTYRFQWGAL